MNDNTPDGELTTELHGELEATVPKRGRPSKFTPERTEKVLQALRAGHYRTIAAQYAGVSYETLRRWMKEGENPDADPEYQAFRIAISEAEAISEITDLALIRQAAKDGDWKAAAWRLQHRSPERWGGQRGQGSGVQEHRVTVEGQVEHQHQVAAGVDALSIETLAQSLASRAAEALEEAALGELDVVDAEVVEDDRDS